MGPIFRYFRESRFRELDMRGFESKLFFEGQRRRQYRARYYSLCLLSTVIASYGILNGSPATVIGAMIIAPMMTPIMATAAALVMGDTERDIRSLTLVALGALLVLLVSWLIGELHSAFNIISIAGNEQITTRIAPRSTDLIIALASGAAGALALSRDDIADSLPGVAIAISLVPPLCVAGLCLAIGEQSAAVGAVLLFLTNFLSILLAGGGVFLLLGLRQASGEGETGPARRHAFKTVMVGLLLISIPLLGTSSKLAQQAVTEHRTIEATKQWLQGSGYSIIKIGTGRRSVTITIGGQGLIPPKERLVETLRSRLRRSITVELSIVPIQVETIDIDLTEPRPERRK